MYKSVLVGLCNGLLISRSSLQFRLKPKSHIHMDLSYIDRPSIKSTKLLLKVIKAIVIITSHHTHKKTKLIHVRQKARAHAHNTSHTLACRERKRKWEIETETHV